MTEPFGGHTRRRNIQSTWEAKNLPATDVKVGDRVRVIHCMDRHTKLMPGTLGTVVFIDDRGTPHINWENGLQLGLIPGMDRFEVIGDEPLQ